MLETIFTGIGSLFLCLISYSYNAWRHTVKENRKVYLQYLWRLSLNETLLHEMQNGAMTFESGCAKLKLLEPYTLRYIHVFDDQLSAQLLSYNNKLLIPVAKGASSKDEVDDLLVITQICRQNVKQHLTFNDEVIGPLSIPSFFCYVGLPVLIDWIVKKYLSQTANDVTNNTKSN